MKIEQQKFLQKMLQACSACTGGQWQKLAPYAENELKSLLLMIDWLAQMRQSGEMRTEQARIHIDIQKTTMRTRLMAMPGMDMVDAENVINAAIDSIRKDLYDLSDWVII